jgi:hypothetical protein
MSTNDDLLTGDRTFAESVSRSQIAQPTRTSQDELAAEAGLLRTRARFITQDVTDTHHHALGAQLEARTDEAAKRSVGDLLNELAEVGFAWRDIARLVGVTVPAVRKWRNGELATGPHRRAVARLLAFVDVLRSDHLVQDVPSWLEMPLSTSTTTGLDVYAMARGDLLLAHAAEHLSSEDVLDNINPSWREEIDQRFEIFTAEDGEQAIRPRPGATSA